MTPLEWLIEQWLILDHQLSSGVIDKTEYYHLRKEAIEQAKELEKALP